MDTPILYVILSFVPVGLIALVLETWRRFDTEARLDPGNDKLLRPPGESARRQIEGLDGKIWELTLWIFGFPSTLLLCYLSNIRTSPASGVVSKLWLAAFIIAAIILTALVWKLGRLVQRRNDWRLAFNGQRAVGEHLNQLMAEGCRVFHNFPLPNRRVINHVVIAPSGVFAIQTCARRKGPASRAHPAHEVIYDGKTLEFPFRSDGEELDNVRSLATRLQNFLGETFDAPIPVKPVITFPGWYVIQRGEGDVIVRNPRMLEDAILTHAAPVLSHEHIKQVAQLFEQKCRDFEFR
jgi:hypothetical protein